MKRRSLLLGAACALLLALPAGWYFGSPWWTLWRMREAARAGDMRTLASYVDLDAIRKSVVRSARDRLEEEAARLLAAEGAGGGGWKKALRGALSEAVTGAETVKAVFQNIPLGRRDLVRGPLGLNPLVERRSFDEFTVRVRNTPSPGTFTFRRHGLGWKLQGVRLDGMARAGFLSAPPPAEPSQGRE
jgi:hypothetical protein